MYTFPMDASSKVCSPSLHRGHTPAARLAQSRQKAWRQRFCGIGNVRLTSVVCVHACVCACVTDHAAIDEHWEAAHLTDVHERVLYRTAQQVHLLLPPQRAPCNSNLHVILLHYLGPQTETLLPPEIFPRTPFSLTGLNSALWRDFPRD